MAEEEGQVKFGFIMDPLEGVKAYKDTTYYLMLAASELGHEACYLNPNALFVSQGRLWGSVVKVDVHADHQKPFTRHPAEDKCLEEFDVVLVRTDPPFDRSYFYVTLLLDLLPPSTRVLNRPQGLRNWNEKLAALFYPQFGPDTLITREGSRILKFMDQVGRITLKPIDGHGGRGIFFLTPNDPNADAIIDAVTHHGRHQVIAQAYVKEASLGDKRILLLNGEPLGAILRLHQEGKELNNMDAGGKPHPTQLTPRDLEICAAIKPGLIREGIVFSGIDILGDKLIEINVTSPTGLQELCRFNGQPYHHQIIKAMAG